MPGVSPKCISEVTLAGSERVNAVLLRIVFSTSLGVVKLNQMTSSYGRIKYIT